MPQIDAPPTGRGDESPRSAHARRRVRVRRRVAAASFATFALTWGVIAGSGSMGTSSSTAATGSVAADSQQQQQQQQQQSSSALTTRQS